MEAIIMAAKKEDFKYEVINELGVISERNSGWRKEFNRVSWNGGEPKYDVRDWGTERKKIGKGITLTEIEMRKLYELLSVEIAELDS
jgi:hypothetical protein